MDDKYYLVLGVNKKSKIDEEELDNSIKYYAKIIREIYEEDREIDISDGEFEWSDEEAIELGYTQEWLDEKNEEFDDDAWDEVARKVAQRRAEERETECINDAKEAINKALNSDICFSNYGITIIECLGKPLNKDGFINYNSYEEILIKLDESLYKKRSPYIITKVIGFDDECENSFCRRFKVADELEDEEDE